jgi:2-desacetyl-2-hydroxyethyl bacteriochlorophyllide A dehydrogenase
MQALVYTQSYDLEVREVERPEPGDDEVLVGVESAGICGSDVHGVASRSLRRTPPLIMGHELTGQVVAAGGPSGESLLGRRVAVNPQVPCGDCRACRSGLENICGRRGLIGGSRPGGFAEFVSVPLRCVHPLSTDATSEVVVFCEPLAACVHALRLVSAGLTEAAVVLGAGTIGVLATQLLRHLGARQVVVSELDRGRRDTARAFADEVVAPDDLHDTVMELTRGSGASLTIDAVGTDGTRRESLRVLQPAGVALWLGMHEEAATIPAFDLVVNEQRVQGSFAYTNPEFASALGLLESGVFRPGVLTKSFPLQDSGDTFRQLLNGSTDGFLKAIVSPNPAGAGSALRSESVRDNRPDTPVKIGPRRILR